MQKIGAWTDFRRWLYKEGFAIKKGDGKKGGETHLLLNGGRLAVPDERNAEFLTHYAHALFNGDWLYVVEKKTSPIYTYMNEFDIKIKDRELTREELDAIVRIVQGIMSSAFPGQDVKLAVCTAPPKPATLDDGTPVVQSGVHFLWHSVTVDSATAWQLRAWTLRALEAGMTGMPLATRWAEAFDDCVFEANGLRMIGSRKAIICSQCKGQSYKREGKDEDEWGTVCAVCQDVGRVDLGRPYSLLYVAGPDGGIDEAFTQKLLRDPMELVLFTSIRAINRDGSRPTGVWDITFPNAEVKEQVVTDAKRDKAEKKHVTKAKKGAKKDPVAAKDLDELAKKKQERRDALEDVPPNDPVYPSIAEYIHSEFKGQPNVIGIKKGGSGDFYIINSDCTYCYNKGGNHGHSQVFYVLRPKGCVQRCFCPKPIVQMAGGKHCSAYASKPHPVPSDIQELIFTEGVLRTRRKEEKKAKLAAEVFAPIRSLSERERLQIEGELMNPPSTPVEEGEIPDEELGMVDLDAAVPLARAQARMEARHERRFDPRAVMVVRAGAKEYKYKDSRDAIKPRYTPGDFLNAMRNANYKIV